MSTYSVRILEAKYDADEGKLVIYGIFEHNGDRKLIVFDKEDISHTFNIPDLGPDNLRYFAKCLSKREQPFKFIMNDDPDMEKIDEQKQMEYAALFNKRIAEELESVQQGLSDDTQQIQRKIGRLLDKEGLDLNKVLANEIAVRAKLK